MAEILVAHTSSLESATLAEIRALLVDAFDGKFADDDWDHALGGVHVLFREHGALVAHGAVVQRRLVHRGRALRTGYVEGVAVRSDRRRRGLGSAVMEHLADVIRGAYELGALSAGGEAARLYRSLGWRPWRGRTWALGPNGRERTPDEDETIYVLTLATAVDLSGDLACDWRDGDVW